MTTGYGTTAAADEQIATFTSNGRLLTLTDAEANRTTYEYRSYHWPPRVRQGQLLPAACGGATS